jgi:hypothetical protein
MLDKILDTIRNFFKDESPSISSSIRHKHAMEEYRDTFEAIRSSRSLAALLESRKRIRKFQQHLIENEIELWGRQLVVDLNKYWAVKYDYWKKKTRGI